MDTSWSCDKCNKQYKTLTGFTNHQCKNQRNDKTVTPKKRKKFLLKYVLMYGKLILEILLKQNVFVVGKILLLHLHIVIPFTPVI